MANIHGVKGRNWTPEEIELAQGMRAEGLHIGYIAETLDRTFSSVEAKLRFLKNAPVLAQRALVPEAIESDDDKHLALLLSARPSGFPVAFLPAKYRVAA